MKKDQSLQELRKKLEPFGFQINDQGEIIVIGERDGKEYKIGQARRKMRFFLLLFFNFRNYE